MITLYDSGEGNTLSGRVVLDSPRLLPTNGNRAPLLKFSGLIFDIPSLIVSKRRALEIVLFGGSGLLSFVAVTENSGWL